MRFQYYKKIGDLLLYKIVGRYTKIRWKRISQHKNDCRDRGQAKCVKRGLPDAVKSMSRDHRTPDVVQGWECSPFVGIEGSYTTPKMSYIWCWEFDFF